MIISPPAGPPRATRTGRPPLYYSILYSTT